MIGHGEIESHQFQHRGHQALYLTQPQAEHQTQRQGGLATVSDCPPLAKTSLVFRPVRQLELHLADMMAGGIVFEGHGQETDIAFADA